MNILDEEADGLAEAIAASFVDYFEAGGRMEEIRQLTKWDDFRVLVKIRFPDKYLKMVAAGWF